MRTPINYCSATVWAKRVWHGKLNKEGFKFSTAVIAAGFSFSFGPFLFLLLRVKEREKDIQQYFYEILNFTSFTYIWAIVITIKQTKKWCRETELNCRHRDFQDYAKAKMGAGKGLSLLYFSMFYVYQSITNTNFWLIFITQWYTLIIHYLFLLVYVNPGLSG